MAAIAGEVPRPIGLPISGTCPGAAEMATKAAEYKARRGLFDLTPPTREKAIANRTKRAHGKRMHNNGVGAGLFAKGVRA
jgi:hypothetical protein